MCDHFVVIYVCATWLRNEMEQLHVNYVMSFPYGGICRR